MHSRVFNSIWTALQSGEQLDKHTAAMSCHCDPKTAQRILSHLHLELLVRVCDWTQAGESHVIVPVYEIIQAGGSTIDMPRPSAKTKDRTVYNRQRRRDPDVREREATIKRNKRALADTKKSFDETGCSMWKSILGVVKK